MKIKILDAEGVTFFHRHNSKHKIGNYYSTSVIIECQSVLHILTLHSPHNVLVFIGILRKVFVTQWNL